MLFIFEIILPKNIIHSIDECHNSVKGLTLVVIMNKAFHIPSVVEVYFPLIIYFLEKTINGLAIS